MRILRYGVPVSDPLRAPALLTRADAQSGICLSCLLYTSIAREIPFGPGKAVNAGGVATSGLEMSQNAMKMSWSAAEVDRRLREIMTSIHDVCVRYGTGPDGYVNYMKGANIAGFMKVARSMVEQGVL